MFVMFVRGDGENGCDQCTSWKSEWLEQSYQQDRRKAVTILQGRQGNISDQCIRRTQVNGCYHCTRWTGKWFVTIVLGEQVNGCDPNNKWLDELLEP
jgi:hypothetical protein